MRFMALATDYDGTIAHHGKVDDATVAALKRCAESGRKLILVTGRELPDLMKTFPRIDLFDWVVAENGALLYQPSTRLEQPLAPPPPEQFVSALKARGVAPCSTGHVIVATWQPHETTVLKTIRDLGLELQVIFNKGAVMVLPSGINKATGLQSALKIMGLSPHDTIAVGDAENDHALLSSCEAGVALANAVPMLKDHADLVTKGDHGAGVQELIELLVSDDLSALEAKLTRHHVLLGHTTDGKEYRLSPFRDNILVVGTSGGGKSTVATAFIERLGESGYQACVIDPEGDYDEFEGLVPVGTPRSPPAAAEIVKLIEAGESIAVNMVSVPFNDRPASFVSVLARMQDLRARVGRPHWIVVDETHHVLPANWQPGEIGTPRRSDRMLFVTLEPKLLPVSTLETVDLVLAIGKAPAETLAEFASLLNLPRPSLPTAPLEQGTMIAWHIHPLSEPVEVKVAPARAQRRRHSRKYAEGELPPDRSFFFRGAAGKLNLRAHNLIAFLQMAAGVDDETWLHHLGRGDYSQWFREMVKDSDLGDEAAKVEGNHEISARQSRQAIAELIKDRYTLPGSTTDGAPPT